MSGHGGTKHRKHRLGQKRTQNRRKAQADVARVRGLFEAKGQAWDPLNNTQQMAAMNHDARRLVKQQASLRF